MKPTFWKLSQGPEYFSYQNILESISSGFVYVHKDTKAKATSARTQGEDFIEAKIGDYFYLTFGNEGIFLLGQFSGAVNIFSSKRDGWLDRQFRVIRLSKKREPYNGVHCWWAPIDNSTFTVVPEVDLIHFEREILIPYFDIKLSDYDIAT